MPMGRSAQLFGRPDLSDFREETASPYRSATQHELARIELLAGLPGETLARLGRRMEREEVASGTVLIREGEPDDRFFVLLAGVLAVSQRDLGARSLLRPGDYFGEVAPAMSIPRTATVSAMTPAVVAGCARAMFDCPLRPLPASGAYRRASRSARVGRQ